jgi:hypothetical protein
LPSATFENLVAVRRQAIRCELTTCYLTFGESKFDLDAQALEGIENEMRIRDASDLHRHVASEKPLGVFLQSPYPEHYPEWFEREAAHIPLAYAGYALGLGTWTEGNFHTGLIQKCTYLLACCATEFEGYQTHNPQARVTLAGSPLLYEVRRAFHAARPHQVNRENATLLWAPHWTRTYPHSPRGYSRWMDSVDAILTWTQAHPSCRLIFRPHPILRHAIDTYLAHGRSAVHREAARSVDVHEDRWALELLRTLLRLSNVEISSGSLEEDVMRSDGLVTDGISIIAFWAATGKPMAVFRDAASAPLNDEGMSLVAAADVVRHALELHDWLGSWASQVGSSRGRLVSASEAAHPSFEESPVGVWLNTLSADTPRTRAKRSLWSCFGTDRTAAA